MMARRLSERVRDERGFTLIELLVVTILIGILAAIALAVFLNQQDKGRDASVKSDVTNLAHVIEACSAGSEAGDDYRNCDTVSKIGAQDIKVDPFPPTDPGSSDCSDPNPVSDAPASGFDVRIVQAGQKCYALIGHSSSSNVFWYVKHDNGAVTHDCTTHGVNGCPSDGQWAG